MSRSAEDEHTRQADAGDQDRREQGQQQGTSAHPHELADVHPGTQREHRCRQHRALRSLGDIEHGNGNDAHRAQHDHGHEREHEERDKRRPLAGGIRPRAAPVRHADDSHDGCEQEHPGELDDHGNGERSAADDAPGSHDLGDLDRIWAARPQEERRGWRQETPAIVAGQVIGMRKRGDSQAFVQLDDGRGRIECAFFAEAWNECAPLLTRDRILLVEGGLREDEFSGGFSLRARRCWDFRQVCEQGAERLSIRIDLRDPATLPRFRQVLAEHEGQTPLLLEAITPNAVGRLSLNGGRGVRVGADLPGLLRALPGVRKVQLALGKPWAG